MTKTVVVTGASRGIGYHTALKLSEAHKVIAIARSENKLKKLASLSKNITAVPSDITTETGLEEIKQVCTKAGSLHGLINNAGHTMLKSFMETSADEFRMMMDANFFSAQRLTQILKPMMPEGSHILNISSMSGFQGAAKFPGLSAYGAAKSALTGLTESLAVEFSKDGVAVNCLCIGAVQTEMLQQAFPGYEAPVKPEQMGAYIADFVLTGHQFYNGKILPVALSDPE